MKTQSRLVALAGLLLAGLVRADAPLQITGTWRLGPVEAPAARYRLQLELVAFRDSRWRPDAILAATREAAGLLAHCGIRLERAELRQLDGGRPEYRYLDTPASRELARRLALARPAVFFVEDTRHRPAFDAEAFGRGNTGTRPELANTVWVTADARDLPVTLAHELAHVLMNAGEHVELPGNLMRDETSSANVSLTGAQCARLVDNGLREGLLQPER
jgi:hypothetical protein